MKNAMLGIFIMSSIFHISSFQAFAHQGHHHSESSASATPHGEHADNHQEGALHVEKEKQIQYARINEMYVAKVKPIFQKKCMDCHGGESKFPWYHHIPGIMQAIDADVRESKEHIDLSGGFPFKSHASPEEDLDACREIAQKGSMPPLGYRLLHWDSKLTDEDKKAILEWVDQAQKELKK